MAKGTSQTFQEKTEVSGESPNCMAANANAIKPSFGNSGTFEKMLSGAYG